MFGHGFVPVVSFAAHALEGDVSPERSSVLAAPGTLATSCDTSGLNVTSGLAWCPLNRGRFILEVVVQYAQGYLCIRLTRNTM